MNLYRLTTNGMLYSYRANLQNSYRTLADAMTKVQTNQLRGGPGGGEPRVYAPPRALAGECAGAQ